MTCSSSQLALLPARNSGPNLLSLSLCQDFGEQGEETFFPLSVMLYRRRKDFCVDERSAGEGATGGFNLYHKQSRTHKIM